LSPKKPLRNHSSEPDIYGKLTQLTILIRLRMSREKAKVHRSETRMQNSHVQRVSRLRVISSAFHGRNNLSVR